MAKRQTEASVQSYSGRLMKLVTALSLLLLGLLLLERFGWAIPELAKGAHSSQLMRRIGFEIVAAVPEVIYLLSLWWIRQALAAFAKGDFYASIVTRMLRLVGILLATGAFLNLFIVPALDRAIGMSPGYWIAFDVTGFVLGTMGLSLWIVSRVLDRARDLKAELDGIF